MPEETHKTTAKIGAAEFEAEGTQASVEAQLKAFLATVATCAEKGLISTSPKEDSDAKGVPGRQADAIDNDILDAVLEKGDDNIVHLRTSPETGRQGDVLLLLLLGYHDLARKHDVSGAELKESVQRSGVEVKRPDRALEPLVKAGLVREGGRKSGKRYALKQNGRAKALELIDAML